MIKITRRQFLKGSAAIGVAGALSGTVLNTLRPSKAYAAEAATVGYTPTGCVGCTTWCPVEVKTQTDTGIKRAIDVRGNKYCKREDETDGGAGTANFVCPRARIALQEAYDADRVKVAMKRANASKGRAVDPQFYAISLDDAMNEIAQKMIAVRGTTGDTVTTAHKYTYFRGRYTYGRATMYDALKAIYGTPNSVSHSAICAEAENEPRYHIAGKHGYSEYDLDNCRYLLLWGVDPLSSNRMVSGAIHKLAQRLNADNITVVSIDSRLNAISAKAHKWLPVKPGTDGALALAMAAWIVQQGLANKDFVGNYPDPSFGSTMGSFTEVGTKGLKEWWDTVLKDCDPDSGNFAGTGQSVTQITGIPASVIKEVAEGFAGKGISSSDERAKAISWQGPGPTMQPNGFYTGWAILALNGLVGSFDHKGGEIHNEGSVNYSGDAPSYSSYKATNNGSTQKMTKYIASGVELNLPAIEKGTVGGRTPTNRAADSIRDKSPYETKFVIGIMNNFPFSCTETKRWEDALSTENTYNPGTMNNWDAVNDDTAPPFVVHVTTHASEFSKFADIVIPGKHVGLEAKSSTHQRSGMWKSHHLYNQVIPSVWSDALNGESEFQWKLAQAFNAQGWSKFLNYLRTEYVVGMGYSSSSALAGTEDPSVFEDWHFKYHATKGTSAERATQWTQMNAAAMTKPGQGGQEVGNGICQSTYATDYFDGNGRGKAWVYAIGGGGTTYFGTPSTKIEFYNPASKILGALSAHATAHSTSIAAVMTACNYTDTASGIGTHGDKYAGMPHYESPKHQGTGDYKYQFIDYKSRLNREGRSQNAPWYYEFKSNDPGDEKWKDVIKINPIDAAAIGVVDGDTVRITSPSNTTTGITCKVKVWAGVRAGTVAKSFGQGHWAYGRYANSSGGGNNNEILPSEYERLTGSTARNAVTKVKIVKV